MLLRVEFSHRESRQWPTDDGLRRHRDGLVWSDDLTYSSDGEAKDTSWVLDENDERDYEPYEDTVGMTPACGS